MPIAASIDLVRHAPERDEGRIRATVPRLRNRDQSPAVLSVLERQPPAFERARKLGANVAPPPIVSRGTGCLVLVRHPALDGVGIDGPRLPHIAVIRAKIAMLHSRSTIYARTEPRRPRTGPRYFGGDSEIGFHPPSVTYALSRSVRRSVGE